MIFVILPVIFIGIVLLWLRNKVLIHVPETYPGSYAMSASDKSLKTLVCFGDSNTHGNVSYDWVSVIREEFPGMNVFNAGINSDLTFSLLRRIDDVVAAKPDLITILIGTNDVNAACYGYSEKHYRSIGRLKPGELPGIEGFEENYRKIIDLLKTKTKAEIALLSLPLMGEELSNRTNVMADEYSAIISKIARDENLRYLPVREGQKAYITGHPNRSKYTFNNYSLLLIRSVLLRYLSRKSWNSISAGIGNILSPDFLHQNELAGGMIVIQVKDWINSKLQNA